MAAADRVEGKGPEKLVGVPAGGLLAGTADDGPVAVEEDGVDDMEAEDELEFVEIGVWEDEKDEEGDEGGVNWRDW